MNLFPIRQGLKCFLVLKLILILLPTMSAATDVEEKLRLPLTMEVFLKKPVRHMYELHIHLTNVSDKSVTVDVRDLPWNPTDGSTWLMAIRLNPQKSLIRQNYPRGRFGSRMVQLVPGESIQGKISLHSRISSLLKDIKHFGVQLYWDCPPSNLIFVCKQDAPNTITIPKEDPGQPDIYSIDTNRCRTLEGRIGLIDIPKGDNVLFLQTTESVMTDILRMQTLLIQVDDYVKQCQPTWTNSWAVSFVTDKKFAGFLSDEKNKHYFEQGLWQRGNIGQYSSQIRTLFRFPWIKKKADTIYLSVYHIRQQKESS